MDQTRKIAAFAATVAMAAGTIVMGAGTAQAASDPDFKKVSAPKTVTAGQMFRIKCQMKRNVNWQGADAMLDQKAATINAQRPVSAKGNCSMRVVLRATGNQKIRVIVTQNLGALESKWLKIKVQPS
jgi:hypothetical protein